MVSAVDMLAVVTGWVVWCIVWILYKNSGTNEVCDLNVWAAPNGDAYVPRKSFGSASLGNDGDANKLFVTYLFIDKYLGIQFLNDVGLLSKVTCNTCSCDMTWCVEPKLNDGFRWRFRIYAFTGYSAESWLRTATHWHVSLLDSCLTVELQLAGQTKVRWVVSYLYEYKSLTSFIHQDGQRLDGL